MKVWVTRDEDPNGPLSRALRAAGLSVVHEPVVKRRVLTDAGDVLARLGGDDWLVLTSVFAVEAVDPDHARVPRVAVIGEASRRAAEARGFRVQLVGGAGDVKSLFQMLKERVSGGRICYPRSSLAEAPEPWPGIELLSPVLYETLPREFDRSVIHRVDVVSVASPSAVAAVLAMGSEPRALAFASIGATTSDALRRAGVEPWVEAAEPSFTTLAQAIADRSV